VDFARDSVFVALVRNPTPYPIHVQQIRLADTANFSLVSGAAPYTLRPGSAQSLELRFRPRTAAVKRTKLTLVTSSETLETTVQGEGITPPLELKVALVDMGSARVGGAKGSILRGALRNVGKKPVHITAIRQDGPNVSDFQALFPAHAFPIVLAPGAVADMPLRFSPRELGRTSGKLLFDYDGFGSPLSLRLFGAGTVYWLTLSGETLDSVGGAPIRAVIHWEDADTGEVLGESLSDAEGRYSVRLPSNRRYVVRYEKQEYYPVWREITPPNNLERDSSLSEAPVLLARVSLEEAVRRNPTAVIPDISFDFNEAVLKPSIYRYLNDIASVLRQYPAMRVTISGHADAVGTEAANKKLSEQRAHAVFAYLVRNGCEPRSFVVKGLGAQTPVASNDSEAGRSANRRVELRCAR
jgi:outer membrane protein OmpA-like peptidoglycan-associated protein